MYVGSLPMFNVTIKADYFYKIVTVTDTASIKDFLMKIAFTLTGKDARRVYYHKVWYDTIDPDDYNVRIDASATLLNTCKTINQTLNANIQDTLNEIESTLSTLTKVKYGDNVLAEHINTFIDIITRLHSAAKTLYDKYKETYNSTIPIVEEMLTLADHKTQFLIKAYSFSFATTRHHNQLIDLLKILEIAITKLEEAL